MSSTLLEQARSLHEDLEVLEKAMYKELGDVSTATKRRADEIARDQVVATMLDSHTKRSRQLAQLYNDNDGARRDELTAMTGSGVFTAFYDQLKAIREYHRKFPSQPSTESAETLLLSEVLESAPDEGFTGEEAEGRYMDLHAMHERYLNLKGVERVDYVAYLKQCGRLAETVPKESVSTANYARYAKELHRTFLEFVAKTQPLVPTTKMLEAAESDFAERWTRGEVTRYQSAPPANAPDATQPVVLSSYSSAAELEALGMDLLKVQLTTHGLKAGGSLQQRAARLYLLKDTPYEQIPKKDLAKPGEKANGDATNGDAPAPSDGGNARAMALLEEQILRLGELLLETLEATASMVERKQARTYEELERDLAAAEEEAAGQEEAEDEDDDEEKPIYNPLNLPLGLDGKPIPYWLYKLHGLNLEFKCEICGNYSYWGPRPFERHFQEWRHAYGMKCLGIPNSKPFQGIMLIEDAYTLWAKLKAEQGTTSFNADTEEEFEDKSGNVMARKIYADLARQGLLD